MLEIKYLPEVQELQLDLINQFNSWPYLRSSILENAEEVTFVGAYTLRLPVWAFYSCREALAYTLRKFNIKLVVDEQTEVFLNKAKGHQNEYELATTAITLNEEKLFHKLRDENFIRILTEEQKRNVLKLVSLPSGATFSVPGAGKTTEALAFFFFKRKPETHLLVVAPKNTFAAWEEQIFLCVNSSPKITRLIGGYEKIKNLLNDNENKFFLITYQQLPNVKNLIANHLVNNQTIMFLDESHHIKRGVEGQWSNSVLSLAHLPEAKLIMTGTPLPNSVADLIPQFNFIYPELDIQEENAKSIIKPLFVRTTKKELNLPDVRRILTPIQLTEDQRHLYDLIRSEQARIIEGLKAGDKNELRRISKSALRLIQLVSNPALLLKWTDLELSKELFSTLSEGDSPKVSYACQKARKLAKEGKKVLIWSSFVENVEIIASRLLDLGADFIHGGVDTGNEEEENSREYKIKKFKEDDKAFVLVANPAACAEGISLHLVCHHAIYIDRTYNAAQYLQSEDRIHRLGLKPDTLTTIEILHAYDTIDVSVLRRLNKKIQKMSEVLNDDSLNIEPTIVDIEEDGIDFEDGKDIMRHILEGK